MRKVIVWILSVSPGMNQRLVQGGPAFTQDAEIASWSLTTESSKVDYQGALTVDHPYCPQAHLPQRVWICQAWVLRTILKHGTLPRFWQNWKKCTWHEHNMDMTIYLTGSLVFCCSAKINQSINHSLCCRINKSVNVIVLFLNAKTPHKSQIQ